MWNIVWVSPQEHRSVSVSRHFLLQAPQCPWSVRKRLSILRCSDKQLQVAKLHHSVFTIWKFRNIHFAGKSFGEVCCNFYDDDVITVTSLVLRTQSVGALFCKAVSFATCQVLNCIASYEKREQVQQANVFKFQTLTFHFSKYRPNSIQTFIPSHAGQTARENQLLWSLHQLSKQHGTRSILINTFSPWANFNFTPNIKHLSPYTRYISN